MTRKLWVLGIVAILGLSAAVAGFSSTHKASACDDNTKSAATSSCCAKEGAKSASADANKVHNSMIKSAMVAPGAAPILNAAAFGGMMAKSGSAHECDWCPRATTASACAAHMTASECSAKMSSSECASKMGAEGASASACPFMAQQNAAVTADAKGVCPHSTSATMASSENAGCNGSMATVAAAGHECSQNAATVAAHDGCEKNASAAGAGCCGEKAVKTASSEESCCSATKTASLKGIVDEMPYRENKRVVLAGTYACGHCTLQKTEDCSPMLKTADGKIYPLLQNSHASELRDSEGKNVEVSGTVKKVDGVKFLEVKSYKVL